jgi:hypothetical protein
MLVLVALVKAPPALMVPIVDDLARQHTPLYVSAALYNVSYVKMYSDPFLARALRVGTPPDGGYAILDEHGWSRAEIARVCSHSTDKWRVITTVRSPSMIAKFIDISGAGRHLPSRIIKYLDRDDINVVLARRSC